LHCEGRVASGFFVERDRLVATLMGLCNDLKPPMVELADGRRLQGKVHQFANFIELMTIEVPGAHASPLPLGDASTLQQGELVYFAGSPFGLAGSVSQSMISHSGRVKDGHLVFQLDGNVNPGSIGGPVLDARGNVVGIVEASVPESSGLGLAIPVDYLYLSSPPLAEVPIEFDASAWDQMVRRFAPDRRPIAGAALADQRGMVVNVFARAERQPSPETFRFQIRRDGEVVCSPNAEPASWQPTADYVEGKTWTQLHEPTIRVWLARVLLDLGNCPLFPRNLYRYDVVLVRRDGGGKPVEIDGSLPERFLRQWPDSEE
jgi:hypothetical protein